MGRGGLVVCVVSTLLAWGNTEDNVSVFTKPSSDPTGEAKGELTYALVGYLYPFLGDAMPTAVRRRRCVSGGVPPTVVCQRSNASEAFCHLLLLPASMYTVLLTFIGQLACDGHLSQFQLGCSSVPFVGGASSTARRRHCAVGGLSAAVVSQRIIATFHPASDDLQRMMGGRWHLVLLDHSRSLEQWSLCYQQQRRCCWIFCETRVHASHVVLP